ncbi:uncharacterized protein NECHADRAFT_85219 [Fusarium vanettenii 77-13-4]|uniref:Uncharacterized protein n=1 Tax=Fusarium vanettenii (strain ATCC MYA-4622 / CBS 123669 / FGSC 9596 / NRRL 45880 / 77-13-4) TaxID=660122 RepID=C7YVB7_FUSV7|nr:uncharacterized protein NECHADRAFT_85219 [Fusarium vanettenii 77-13-4]EEU44953.1 predicted protein [Fusarium vanettenii 77-13-4]
MAPNKKPAHIKVFPIPRLSDTRTETNGRRFQYCDETHGAILNALLDKADEPNNLGVVLNQGFDKFHILMQKCNLGPRDRWHRKTTAIRDCVDWVRARAREHGALIFEQNRWVRGRSFKSDAEATEWLDTKISGRARPTSLNQSLPALDTLSLADSEPDEYVTQNTGRRVSFSQPSPSRSRSSSRTRRFSLRNP